MLQKRKTDFNKTCGLFVGKRPKSSHILAALQKSVIFKSL